MFFSSSPVETFVVVVAGVTCCCSTSFSEESINVYVFLWFFFRILFIFF